MEIHATYSFIVCGLSIVIPIDEKEVESRPPIKVPNGKCTVVSSLHIYHIWNSSDARVIAIHRLHVLQGSGVARGGNRRKDAEKFVYWYLSIVFILVLDLYQVAVKKNKNKTKTKTIIIYNP